MAINMNSPGVYTRETDYSQYIDDSSSCVIGIVGAARRGPIGVPTLLTSQKQCVQIFGEPVEGEYGLYSAFQILSKASRVYYVRVSRSGKAAIAGIYNTDKVIYTAREVGTSMNDYKVVQEVNVTTDEETEVTTTTYTIKLLDGSGSVVETFNNVSLNVSDPNFISAVVSSGSEYFIAEVQTNGTFTAKTIAFGATNDTKGVDTGKYAHAGIEGTDKLTFTSKYYDSVINGYSIVLGEVDDFGYLDVLLYDSMGQLVEKFNSLTLNANNDRFVERVISTESSLINCTMNLSDSVSYTAKTLVFYGGDDGISGISASDIIGQTNGTGLYAFSNSEIISIDILAAPGWYDRSVINAGISICESRTDTLYIIDPPFGLSPQAVINWSNGSGAYSNYAGFDSSYAALYWPWLRVSDSFTSKNIWLPPSAFVISQIAYNDEVAYPWTAPAGLNRGRITRAIGVEMSPTQGERDALYGNRNIVNPIANFVSNGIVIWGQKTTQRAPTALDRVNVRRLLIYLKRSIGIATRSFVFEQDVPSTWERWRLAATPVLENCRVHNGLYAYRIVVDNNDTDTENNRKNIYVYVKPTKTTEFIGLTFNIMPYSASFDNL